MKVINSVFLASMIFLSSLAMAEDKSSTDSTLHKAGGLDFYATTSGFGFGGFYGKDFGSSVFGFVRLFIAEAKDESEVELFNYWTGQKFSPGKINRFLIAPLSLGLEYYPWLEDMADNFRPYFTFGLGPALVYSAPYTEWGDFYGEPVIQEKMDFFKSLGKGQAHYTLGGYVGFGAFFGDARKLTGLSLRYYFIPIAGGIPSLGDLETGQFIKKTNFGDFSIVFTWGF